MEIKEINDNGKNEIRVTKNWNCGQRLTFSLTWPELWELYNFAALKDARNEVHEYILQCDEIAGFDCAKITPEMEKEIAGQIIRDRIAEESGDQIYYAAEKIINKRKKQ